MSKVGRTLTHLTRGPGAGHNLTHYPTHKTYYALPVRSTADRTNATRSARPTSMGTASSAGPTSASSCSPGTRPMIGRTSMATASSTEPTSVDSSRSGATARKSRTRPDPAASATTAARSRLPRVRRPAEPTAAMDRPVPWTPAIAVVPVATVAIATSPRAVPAAAIRPVRMPSVRTTPSAARSSGMRRVPTRRPVVTIPNATAPESHLGLE